MCGNWRSAISFIVHYQASGIEIEREGSRDCEVEAGKRGEGEREKKGKRRTRENEREQKITDEQDESESEWNEDWTGWTRWGGKWCLGI